MVKLYQQTSDYIYSQLENYYNDEECNAIIEIFQTLYDSNKICSMSAVEVIEETANINHLGGALPMWLYDVVSYEDFCEYIESLDVISLGEDFIKVDDGEYYQISDIANLVFKKSEV